MDIRAEFEGDDTLNIELSGNEMGILIGKEDACPLILCSILQVW